MENFDGKMTTCLGPQCPDSCCNTGSFVYPEEAAQKYGAGEGRKPNLPEGVRFEFNPQKKRYEIFSCLGEKGCKLDEAGIEKPHTCKIFPFMHYLDEKGENGEGVYLSNECPGSVGMPAQFIDAVRLEARLFKRQ
jgi:hypothetical protein